MSEPIKPIEESEEYAAAVEDEAPLSALRSQPAERTSTIAAAVAAAQAYSAAVRATELFIDSLAGRPTDDEVARYSMLQERENVAWQRRREALATVGLRHDVVADDGAW